jgi:23S rRNA (adenine2030-N6)-methyltransferase
MLAYQHAFHAGNHADVLKHVVLVAALRHMNLKDKGYRFVDTHAGTGEYDMASPSATKTGEYRQGIGRLWGSATAPALVADYLRCVAAFNGEGPLRRYPGSPALARLLTRRQDQLRLFEWHPAEHAALQRLSPRGVGIEHADGFAALKSQLPPPTRRALVLIDPSYEGHADYVNVTQALDEALRRFAPGVYIVWYPLVSKPGAAEMVRRLKALAPKGWLHASLSVQPVDEAGFGLSGSGVFIINPPHTLHAALREALPWLGAVLGQRGDAGHHLEQRAA